MTRSSSMCPWAEPAFPERHNVLVFPAGLSIKGLAREDVPSLVQLLLTQPTTEGFLSMVHPHMTVRRSMSQATALQPSCVSDGGPLLVGPFQLEEQEWTGPVKTEALEGKDIFVCAHKVGTPSQRRWAGIRRQHTRRHSSRSDTSFALPCRMEMTTGA